MCEVGIDASSQFSEGIKAVRILALLVIHKTFIQPIQHEIIRFHLRAVGDHRFGGSQKPQHTSKL